MAHLRRQQPQVVPTLLLVLLLVSPTQALLLQLPSLVSLAHSLLLRVANLRIARGDRAGAARVRALADGFRLLGPGGGVWSLGWDYVRNYAWRGGLRGVPSRDAWELLKELRELGAMRSDADRARWIARNYSRVLPLLRSVLQGLLSSFHISGPLREVLMALQAEVSEGELLRDCMEVGAKDLMGLATIARDLFYSSSHHSNTEENEL